MVLHIEALHTQTTARRSDVGTKRSNEDDHDTIAKSNESHIRTKTKETARANLVGVSSQFLHR